MIDENSDKLANEIRIEDVMGEKLMKYHKWLADLGTILIIIGCFLQ